jgi:hypothetical protein
MTVATQPNLISKLLKTKPNIQQRRSYDGRDYDFNNQTQFEKSGGDFAGISV